MKSTVVPTVPMRSAVCGDFDETLRTMKMPMIEHSRPVDASPSGRNIRASRAPRLSITLRDIVEAIAMVAIIAPQ